MRTSESIAQLAPDLVAALGELEGARMDGKNDAFKRNGKATGYATLASVIDATRDVLAAHGLCVIQAPGEVHEKFLIVTTRILHKSGEWMESDFHMPLTEWSPHKAGSATTYGRRYALMAALNLAPIEDDDGNAASEKPAPSRDAAKVTPAQLAEIEDLVEQAGASPSAILQAYSLRTLADLPAASFDKLCTQLRARIAKNNAQKEAA